MPLTIVITGSTKGIGLGLAKYFYSQGHEVVLNGRSQETLQEAIESFPIKDKILPISGDVSDSDTLKNLVEQTHLHFGKIDIWINNAGIPQPYQLFSTLANDEISRLININLLGAMHGTNSAFNYMKKQGHGKIFNLSGFGSDGRMVNKLSLYGTSKRAVSYFTESFYKEHKESGIQIGLINPGMTKTDFIKLDRQFESEKEQKQFDKVYRILAEDLHKVIDSIGPRILQSTKAFDKINYPGGLKLMIKIFKMIIS